MNRLQIVQHFIQSSGRDDLVIYDNTNGHEYGDNGVNSLIHAAQMHLDLLTDSFKTDAWHYQQISEGNYIVNLKYLRSVKGVWVADSDTRTELTRRSIDYVRDEYTGVTGSDDYSRPTQYCLIPVGIAPDLLGTAAADFVAAGLSDYGHLYTSGGNFQGGEAYKGILLIPPADGDYTFQVLGRFYEKPLSDDDDETHWSVNHPMLLITAALRQLQVGYRNFQGVRDYDIEIAQKVQLIYSDYVQDEDQEEPQARSSWSDYD